MRTKHPALAPLIESGFDRWFLARRSRDDSEDIAYYLVFAPERISLGAVVQVAAMRARN